MLTRLVRPAARLLLPLLLAMASPSTASDTAKLHVGLPSVGASPLSLEFGTQSMGTASATQSISVFAFSIFPGSTMSIPVSVSNAQFSQTNHCASVVMPGGCTIQVAFTPSPSAGLLNSSFSVTGTLTISAPNCDYGGYFSPCIRIPLTGTAERSLLTHYYRSILRRPPDPSGRAYWDNEVIRLAVLGANINEAWFAMAKSFYASAEYISQGRDNAAFVTDLYNTFFNRPPDPSGVVFWATQLADGLPREVALASFMFSTEFAQFTQGVFGNTAARAEVDTVVDFYRGILARVPDSAGFGFWLGRFRDAQCQGAGAVHVQVEAISSTYLSSQEYSARNRTHAEYVGDLYNAFLRRGGDIAGVLFWINELQAGMRTRDQVRQAFLASPEFTTRVNAIVAQGCLS